MSATVDTVLTIAGFVVVALAVVVVIAMAPFAGMLSDGFSRDTPRSAGVLVVATIFLPAGVVVGVYVVAVVLAYGASGVRFYYPWVAFVVGAAAWAGIGGGLNGWLRHIQRASTGRGGRSGAELVVPEGWDGVPRSGQEALIVLQQWAIRYTGESPTALDSMRADRFESGWVISVPPVGGGHCDGGPSRYRPIFLVGDSGRVQEIAGRRLDEACRQFGIDESRRGR